MRLTAFLLFLFAQDVEIKPRLAAGDSFRLEVTHIRENSARPQSNGRSRTPVDVRVVSANADGTVLDWTPGPTAFDNPLIAQDPAVAAAARAVQEIRFRIMLNPEGEYAGLANEAEVSSKMQSMTGAIIKELSARLTGLQKQAFENAAQQLLTPALLISSATRDAQIYFGLNGATLAPGETLEAPLNQPSPIGGGTIAATYRVRMESSTEETAALSTTTVYDAQALRRMTAALFKQTGTPIPDADLAKIPPMQMDDGGKYLYDRRLGLMREVAVNRRIAAGTDQRLDGWIIRLVDGPRR